MQNYGNQGNQGNQQKPEPNFWIRVKTFTNSDGSLYGAMSGTEAVPCEGQAGTIVKLTPTRAFVQWLNAAGLDLSQLDDVPIFKGYKSGYTPKVKQQNQGVVQQNNGGFQQGGQQGGQVQQQGFVQQQPVQQGFVQQQPTQQQGFGQQQSNQQSGFGQVQQGTILPGLPQNTPFQPNSQPVQQPGVDLEGIPFYQ